MTRSQISKSILLILFSVQCSDTVCFRLHVYWKKKLNAFMQILGCDLQVMLAIVQRSALRQRFSILEEAGLEVDGMSISSEGVLNWFLNTERGKRFRSAPNGNVFFLGAGTNMIWLDPTHDMVVVVRWLNSSQVDAFIQRVLAAFGGDAES